MNRAQRRATRPRSGSTQAHTTNPSRAFAEALRHQQAGRLNEAIAAYGVVLQHNAHLPEAHYNRGVALKQQGRLDEAVSAFRRALSLQPNDADTQNNLGNALAEQGHTRDAITCYRRALTLQPLHVQAHCNLGKALRQAGELAEAIACLQQALELDPALSQAHFDLGIAYRQREEPKAAEASFRAALTLRPDHPEAYYNLGVTLQSLDRLPEAIACYRKAIALSPRFVEAYSNLGEALRLHGQCDAAIDCLRTALAIKPDLAEPINNLGVALTEQGRLDEAIACFQQVLRGRPDADALNNLGIALLGLRRLDDVVACHRRSLELRPDGADAHFLLGMALLARGELTEGWREYEWRWQTPQLIKAWRGFPQPQWRGEAGDGRTLLIHAEQGFGDTLQFCRYAPLAAARGWRLVMEVPRSLVRLIGSLAGVDAVVACGDRLPDFDLHCPMLSLPLALDTTMLSIPSAPAYLHADTMQAAAWQRRLAGMVEPGLRVGLVWAGNPRTHLPSAAAVDRRRSMAAEHLAPLADVPGVHFFSLQKDSPAAAADLPLVDVMQEMNDFADTAALIANLDLVISVDTAVAHLAAALGKPVWLLDRFDACWRWFTGRHDSPWYPTLRLYRQPQAGDWHSVVAEVVRDLRELARGTDCLDRGDNASLQLVHRLQRDIRADFTYLEIVAQRRDTLIPYLLDPRCRTVLSIAAPTVQAQTGQLQRRYDERAEVAQLLERWAPDLRTAASSKARLYDCEPDEMLTDPARESVDLALIDGERGDATVFADFLYLLPRLSKHGLVVFRAVSEISEVISDLDSLLTFSGFPHAVHMLPDAVAVVSFGSSRDAVSAAFASIANDPATLHAVQRPEAGGGAAY